MEIRSVARGDRGQAIRLVNEMFREEGERTMEVAFARSFSESLSQSLGAFEGERLVAFMGLVPSVVRIGPASVNVYQLGQVCTHPDWQGLGIANLMMEAAVEMTKIAGASLLFVSGARSLYTRHHCLRFGGMWRMSPGRAEAVQLGRPADDEGVELREMGAADWFWLHELDLGMAVRFERSVWDLADLIASEAHASGKRQRHQVYVAAGGGGLLAYIVVRVPRGGEGGSQMGLVEWAGDTDWVAALIGHAMKLHPMEACELSLGWQEGALRRRLEAAGCRSDSQLMPGTIRVIDSARLQEQLAPYYLAQGARRVLWPVRPRQEASEAVEWTDSIGGGVRAGLKDHGGESGSEGLVTLTAQQWIDWLFSPEGIKLDPVLSGLEAQWGRIPVPLPYPGGLNYV